MIVIRWNPPQRPDLCCLNCDGGEEKNKNKKQHYEQI